MAERYFRWLYHRVYSVEDIESPHSYTILCFQMDQIEFVPSIPNDDNRASDVLQLRMEFYESLRPSELARFESWEWEKLFNSGVTIFEMLVGLALRAEFFVGRTPPEWFADFVANLKLSGYSDEAYILQDERKIKRVLQTFNQRRYDSYGRGGIFPLREPEEDQRQVELWYQLAAYAGENQMY
jgi:hypothetical protein